MFENSGELVILALAVIVAFLIATIRSEYRLAQTLKAERNTTDIDALLPERLAPVDDLTVRLITTGIGLAA